MGVVGARATPVAGAGLRADAERPLPRQQVVRRAVRGDPTLEYLVYVPATVGREAPLFVTVHGISRNGDVHAALLAPFAEAHGAVLVAPCFTRGDFADYQRLGRQGRGRRADVALDAILDDVSALTGVSTARFDLFGFSGGAQFAHRYTLAHPERVARAVIAAAGWYTFPDPSLAFPEGIGSCPDLPGVRFEPERFLTVPITVLVGSDDTGGESLRRDAAIDRQQGATRRERAHRWVTAMRRAAEARGLEPRVSCEEVAGIHHSFAQFVHDGGLGERVFAALYGPPGDRR